MVVVLYIHKYLVSIYLSMCAALAKKTADHHVKSGAEDTDLISLRNDAGQWKMYSI